MKYKIQAIRTSDVQNVAICYEKLEPDLRSNFERSKYKFQFYQLWLNLVSLG